MSVQTGEKIRVRCPSCQKQLAVPSRAAGKRVACPACREQFQVPVAIVETAAPPAARPAPRAPAPKSVSPQAAAPPPRAVPARHSDEIVAASLAEPAAEPASPFDFATADHSPSARARRSALEDSGGSGGGFAMEKKGMDMGVVGGILMMILAGVWFVGGLAAGYIFIYPPILFVIGVIAFIKGIADGNVAGRRRRY